MSRQRIILRQYKESPYSAYIELYDHPHREDCGKIVDRTIMLHDGIPDYNGPGLLLDLDENGRALGIEVLYPIDEVELEEGQ